MMKAIDLNALGPRIAIIGPSSSGKSTLCEALGNKLGLKIVHLDLLAHYPNTQWVARPKSEFISLHDIEIAQEHWVMDGNYSAAMPQRFAHATAVIWLDLNWLGCLGRYLVRITKPASMRKGVLPGAVERFNWIMIRYIVWQQPRNRGKYEALLNGFEGPMLRLKSMAELKALYAELGL